MPTVMKRPITYYGVKLSDNVVETPEGYLIFKNAVIARTGFQVYKGRELPQEELEEQGIVVSPDDDVNVYRSPEEVFSKRTIASFEGKPVTDRHPDIGMLDVETVDEYACGHIQNVRAGTEPLENGDMPLLADIFVTSLSIISKWKAGIRELSCGYNYHIVKSGDKILQVDICGNHVAFVENGRAGIHVRVNDSKPTMEKISMETQNDTALGDGLKHVADKSTGAQLGAFMRSLFSITGGRKAAVALDEEAHPTGCKCADCMGGADAAAKDAEKERLHKALDKMLASRDSAKEEQEANDEADMNALKAIFTTPSAEATVNSGADSEEEQEEEQEEVAEEEETAAADEEEEETEAADEAVQSNPSPVIPAGDRPSKDTPSVTDAAYRAGAAAAFKALKPFVARSKDKQLKGAFDTANKLSRNSGWTGAASYGRVARAAAIANDSAREYKDPDQARAELANTAYAQARQGFIKK